MPFLLGSFTDGLFQGANEAVSMSQKLDDLKYRRQQRAAMQDAADATTKAMQADQGGTGGTGTGATASATAPSNKSAGSIPDEPCEESISSLSDSEGNGLASTRSSHDWLGPWRPSTLFGALNPAKPAKSDSPTGELDTPLATGRQSSAIGPGSAPDPSLAFDDPARYLPPTPRYGYDDPARYLPSTPRYGYDDPARYLPSAISGALTPTSGVFNTPLGSPLGRPGGE